MTSLPNNPDQNGGSNGHRKSVPYSFLNGYWSKFGFSDEMKNPLSDKAYKVNTNIAPEILKQDHLSDASNAQHTKPPAEYEDNIWQLGWTDGRYGQPNQTSKEIFRHQSKLKRLESVFQDEKEIAKLRSLSKYYGEKRERLGNRYQQAIERYDDLWKILTINSNDASLALALIYILLALLLLLADIPLSLKLVVEAFKFDNESEQGLARIFALGIALSGIFLKYFLDEIVFHKETHPPQSKRKTRFLWGVFIFYLLTIVALGYFREQTFIRKEVETSISLTKAIEERIAQKKQNGTYDPNKDLEPIISEERKNAFNSAWWEHWSTMIAFICITLMLPLIGGICFTAGWARLEASTPRVFARIKIYPVRILCWWHEKRLSDTSYNFHLASEMLETYRHKLLLENETYTEDDPLFRVLENLYQHGYERGVNVPETLNANESLYERCQKSIEKLLARKTRYKTWNS